MPATKVIRSAVTDERWPVSDHPAAARRVRGRDPGPGLPAGDSQARPRATRPDDRCAHGPTDAPRRTRRARRGQGKAADDRSGVDERRRHPVRGPLRQPPGPAQLPEHRNAPAGREPELPRRRPEHRRGDRDREPLLRGRHRHDQPRQRDGWHGAAAGLHPGGPGQNGRLRGRVPQRAGRDRQRGDADGSNQLAGKFIGYWTSHVVSEDAQQSGAPTPAANYAQYDAGFSLSGPLVRDRAWYFVAYDPEYQTVETEIPGSATTTARRRRIALLESSTGKSIPPTASP